MRKCPFLLVGWCLPIIARSSRSPNFYCRFLDINLPKKNSSPLLNLSQNKNEVEEYARYGDENDSGGEGILDVDKYNW